MNSPRQKKINKILCIILGCVPLYIYISTVCLDPLSISHKILHDDSYYYLGVAKGWIDHGYPTINGIQPTNGFHPGYQYILYLTSKLLNIGLSIQSRSATLYAYCLIGLVCQVISMMSLEISARRYFGFQIANIFAFSFLFSALTFFWFYNGMETGLVIALLSIYVNTYPKLLSDITLSHWYWLKLSVLSFTLVLSRLDLVVPWALTLITVVILALNSYKFTQGPLVSKLTPKSQKSFKKTKKLCKRLCILIISVPALTLTLLSTQASLLNISSLSISSSVKRFWSSQVRHEACSYSPDLCVKKLVIEPLLNTLYMIGDSMSQIYAYFDIRYAYNSDPIYLPSGIYYIIALAIIAVVLFTFLRVQRRNAYASIQGLEMAVMLTSPLMIGACIIGFMSYSLSFNSRSFQWYLYIWNYLVMFYSCGLYGKAQQSTNGLGVLKVTIVRNTNVLTFLGIALALFRLLQLCTSSNSGWAVVYDSAVNQINQSRPINVSTWAAGHICFYSDVTCTNLEGLVHNDTILNHNKNNSLDTYLANQSMIVTNQLYPTASDELNKLSPFDRLRAEPLSKVLHRFKLEAMFKGDGDKMTLIYRSIN